MDTMGYHTSATRLSYVRTVATNRTNITYLFPYNTFHNNNIIQNKKFYLHTVIINKTLTKFILFLFSFHFYWFLTKYETTESLLRAPTPARAPLTTCQTWQRKGVKVMLGLVVFFFTLLQSVMWRCLVLCQQVVPSSELLGLRKIYEDMNGVAWKQTEEGLPWNFSLPDANTHPCRPNEEGMIWQRISCANKTYTDNDRVVVGDGGECSSANCTIVGLDFAQLYELVGIVPEEITLLTSLKSLVLEDQEFADENGQMPSILGELTTLTELSITKNNFKWSTIPESYSKLVNLEIFHVESCNVSGPLPPFLSSMTSLRELLIRKNPMSSSIPSDYFERITNLTSLTITTCSITGSLPSSLQALSNLDFLALSFNSFNSTIYDFEMPRLTRLILNDNDFSGTVPFKLGNLESLEVLQLSSNMLTGSLPHELSRLSRLTTLRIANNLLSSTIPDSIGSMTLLRHLELGANRITGNIPTALSNLPALQYLQLEENNITSTIPTELCILTTLLRFRINNNRMSGSIPNEIGELSSINQLYFQENQFTSSLPVNITRLSNLQFAHFSENLLHGSLPSNLGHLKKLVFLNVSANAVSGSCALINAYIYHSRVINMIMFRHNPILNMHFIFLAKHGISQQLLRGLSTRMYWRNESNEVSSPGPQSLRWCHPNQYR